MCLGRFKKCKEYRDANALDKLKGLESTNNIDLTQIDLNKYWTDVNSLALYQVHESQKIVEEMKCSMLATLRAAKGGYSIAMAMYVLIFILGVSLIIAAVISGYYYGGSTLTILLTSAGTVDLLTFLVRDPPRLLQGNRAQLAKLMAAHFGWWTDNVSLNLWLYGNIRDKSDKPTRTIEDMLRVSETIRQNACAFMEIVKDV